MMKHWTKLNPETKKEKKQLNTKNRNVLKKKKRNEKINTYNPSYTTE